MQSVKVFTLVLAYVARLASAYPQVSWTKSCNTHINPLDKYEQTIGPCNHDPTMSYTEGIGARTAADESKFAIPTTAPWVVTHSMGGHHSFTTKRRSDGFTTQQAAYVKTTDKPVSSYSSSSDDGTMTTQMAGDMASPAKVEADGCRTTQGADVNARWMPRCTSETESEGHMTTQIAGRGVTDTILPMMTMHTYTSEPFNSYETEGPTLTTSSSADVPEATSAVRYSYPPYSSPVVTESVGPVSSTSSTESSIAESTSTESTSTETTSSSSGYTPGAYSYKIYSSVSPSTTIPAYETSALTASYTPDPPATHFARGESHMNSHKPPHWTGTHSYRPSFTTYDHGKMPYHPNTPHRGNMPAPTTTC